MFGFGTVHGFEKRSAPRTADREDAIPPKGLRGRPLPGGRASSRAFGVVQAIRRFEQF